MTITDKFFLQPIVSTFSMFVPYAKAIELLTELDAFNPQSTLYKSLLLSRIKTFGNSNTKAAYLDARQKMSDTLNPNYYLLLTVVGQKAIFKSIFEQIWANFKHGVTPETVSNTVNGYITKLNSALNLFDQNSFFLFGKNGIEISSESGIFADYGTIYSSFWEYYLRTKESSTILKE